MQYKSELPLYGYIVSYKNKNKRINVGKCS